MTGHSPADPIFQREQDFGDAPTKVRETDHYQQEYAQSFVHRWDELIDWDGRAASEGSFFIDALKRHGCHSVIDVACGTGFHSVQLLRAGFDVTSVDGSAEMLTQAFNNASDRGLILKTVHSDWRNLSRDLVGRFDAMICLGNSFTHIFNEHDRRRALAEFYSMLTDEGILILDQRNYDALLDGKAEPGHKYYYCGDKVTAEPEHVDAGLARFRYEFQQDGAVYYLNMFPLRKAYLRGLMHEVGFQKISTWGDFESDYNDNTTDFFIHVAEKQYRPADEDSDDSDYTPAVAAAHDYYNSDDADRFYSTLWGGEDLHLGVYESDDDPVLEASNRTIARMADRVGDQLVTGAKVLDLGGGYGGSARFLADKFGVHVTSLNVSEVQNERARKLTAERGLEDKVRIDDGDFEHIPHPADSFDVVWSQDAFLHSGNRERVLDEVVRVLKPGGVLVFTDPMASDDVSPEELEPVLERIRLETMGSPGYYRKELTARGLSPRSFDDLTDHLVRHYARIHRELDAHRQELDKSISTEYLENMKRGLDNWVDSGASGKLAWGILVFDKPGD